MTIFLKMWLKLICLIVIQMILYPKQKQNIFITIFSDETGKVLHIQDSSFLEEGKGYNEEKVLRFLKSWTPQAIKG